jgi:hypothetical protein
MGFRTQLKNIIKKAIGRETSKTNTVPYTPPTPKSEPEPVSAPTQPEPIETLETGSEGRVLIPQEDSTNKTNGEATQEIREPDSSISAQNKAKEEPAVKEEEESDSNLEAKEEPKEAENGTMPEGGADADGAVAIYPIKNLFGDECPSCGASTFNNWEYSDNNFICQSCQAPL